MDVTPDVGRSQWMKPLPNPAPMPLLGPFPDPEPPGPYIERFGLFHWRVITGWSNIIGTRMTRRGAERLLRKRGPAAAADGPAQGTVARF